MSRSDRFQWSRSQRTATKQNSTKRNQNQRTLRCEPLEDRRMLATVVVGNTLDVSNAPDLTSITALMNNNGGDGISLRKAITAANNTAGPDAITFAVAGTIDTLSQLPTITSQLTITGPGADQLTIDAGNHACRHPESRQRIGVGRLQDGITMTGGRATVPRMKAAVVRSTL